MITSTLEERLEIRSDLLSGKIPKRIPIYATFSFEAACGLAGVDLMRAHYDMSLVEKAYTSICDTFFVDAFPSRNLRFPSSYQLLGAKNWTLGSNGVVQHPEIESMRADEYDQLIEDPYGFLMTTLLPRVCTALDTDPINKSVILSKAYATYNKSVNEHAKIIASIVQKHGYGPGLIAGSLIEAPFDFIADQLRGFKAIMMDIRRIPDKVAKACEAILPMMLKRAMPFSTKPGNISFIPLHLAPYINMKQFETLFWPTLEKLVVEMHKCGVGAYLFAEHDWTRYSDFLERLPDTSIYIFEYGDYAKLKKTAGKDHVIGGFFNPTITLTKSKEECIDEAKRIIETCAPGGRFCFSFDKGVMDIKSIDVSKLQAVLDWVYANTDYR